MKTQLDEITTPERILRLTQTYKALSEINQAIIRMNDEVELFPLVTRVAVEFGGVRMAWIGQRNAANDRLIPTQVYGTGTEYLEHIHVSLLATLPEGRGPTASAYREGHPIIVNHYLDNPITEPWHNLAKRFGWNSCASFPIRRGNRPFAVLTVYHASEVFFDNETISLFNQLVRDIGFALDNFDREKQRQNAMDALETSEHHFRAYFERSMVGMAATCPDRTWLEVNDTLCQILGFSREELSKKTWADLTYPDDLSENNKLFAQLAAGQINDYTIDKRFIRGDGVLIYAHLAARAVRHEDGSLAYVVSLVEDITARKQAETRDHLRQAALERVAKGMPLPALMLALIHDIEASNPEMKCSILLLDEHSETLHTGAAPSLPDFYVQAVDGLRIGPARGSCGTAAYTGQRVIVEDIATHPFWPEPYRKIAAQAGLASSWSQPIHASSGRVLGTFAIYHAVPLAPTLHEITIIETAANLIGIALERRRAEAERHLASLIYQSSSEAMLVTDAQNQIVAINPAFTKIFGYSLDELRGQNPSILRSGRHEPKFYQLMWEAIQREGMWQGELWNRRKNGEIFPEWLTINTIRDDKGQVQRYVALGSDISDKLRSDELIWKQANFDFLTDLPNRYMFHDRLEQEIHKTHRDGSQLALLFIDLDRFKEVNDTLGHAIGDLLLIEAAKRIKACIRESDTVARLGGDEFTVVSSQLLSTQDAESIAQHILAALSKPYKFEHENAYITASIGITIYPDDSTDLDQLLSNADQAMYAAKSAGRNRLSYFTHALQTHAQQRLRLINDLRGALLGEQFEIQFQPIIDLNGHFVEKAEALLRWHHPEKGLIKPGEFIPLAEETGLIMEIGDWVFQEAARWAERWAPLAGEGLQISINMSPLQFQDESFDINAWLSHLRHLGVAAKHLNIEITEGVLLNAHPMVTERLLRFRDAGIQVAIDDFGTGYSALSYLNRFDIDYLKIDQSFVSNLETHHNDLTLSEAIVVMAHKLGLKVIAEGVETEGQRQRLMEIGCDYGQGYLFSKPLSAADFEKLLRQNRSATGFRKRHSN